MTAVFPLAPLDLRTELSLSGWTDITTPYVMQRDGSSPPVSITRGRPNEQSSATPCSMSATWNNRSGNLSPRNPTGTWYGLLGRNTPVRVSVPNPAGAALRIADNAVSYASCPGSSGLECAADLDIRVDCDLDNWAPCLLAGQFFSTASMCWSLSLNGNGTVAFTWYDGSNTNQVSSTMPMPLGRVAIRCYFDPAATSGAAQVVFYTAPTMGGSFTQLGNATAITLHDNAVTSSSAALTVGYNAIWEASADGAQQFGLQGRVYEARLYNGATLAADPVFSAQTAGATSFTDGQSNTWTLSGSASIDARSYRFHGECTTLPQRWDPTGSDVWCPVAAKGVLQRLQQGSSPLPSSMRRLFAGTAAAGYWGTVLGYWPAEDNAGATQVASGLPGGFPLTISGAPAFQGQAGSSSADSEFPCSAQLGQVQSSSWAAPGPAPASTDVSLFMLLEVPSGTAGAVIAQMYPWQILWDPGNGGQLQCGLLTPGSAASTIGSSFITGLAGVPLLVMFWNSPTAGAALTVLPLGAAPPVSPTISQVVIGPVNATPVTGTLIVNPLSAALGSTEIGHLFVVENGYDGPNDGPYGGPSGYAPSGHPESVPMPAVVNAAVAHVGETAGTRFLRLCAESNVAGRVYGYPALTAAMGYQPVDTLANLLQYTETTDCGQVYEPSEALGVGYRTLGSMCAQAPYLTLDYSQAQIGDGDGAGLEPTDDDQYTINDVTVSRTNGSSAQVQITSGPMSVSPPPDGVGDYDTQVTTYNAWDKDNANIAGWLAWVGSCDEERYPVIPLNLARSQLSAQLAAIAGARLGGFFQMENLISQMPPGTVNQILFGYSELLGGKHWHMALNGVPETPYDVAVAGVAHAATAGSELASAYPATTTALSVTTTAGQLWTTSAGDFPFNIMVSGEEMTVTNITGSSSPQTFTVVRSVNGVVTSQGFHSPVQVYPLPVAALAGNH